jgi:intein/homing endonuclease
VDDVIQVAYLAGIFDGEGTITTRKRREKGRRATVRPYIQVKMAWLPTLNKFLERFGGAVRRCNRSCETNKALFKWELLSHRRQTAFLTAALPFLGEKRTQAELLLDYLMAREKHPPRIISQELFNLSQVLHERLREEKRVHFGT